MLKFDATKTKKLCFNLEKIEDIHLSDLNCSFRMVIENIEYGFLCEIVEGQVKVEIPPLKNVVKDLKGSNIYEAKLEMEGNGYHLVTWEDEISIMNQPKLEAKLSSDIIKNDKTIITTIIEDEDKKEKSKVISDTYKEEKKKGSKKGDKKRAAQFLKNIKGN